MANLTHLFKVGQSVKYKNDDFDSDSVNKFISCVVKETYPDHIIITDIETNTDMWCEEGFNMDRVFSEYEYIHNVLGLANKKTVVYQWELDITRKWSIEELKNRIWMNVECGQPISGCVSVESLRVELLRRGEEPVGYHENIEDVDMSKIEIEQPVPMRRRKGR